jgi:hypothetical protein
MNGDKPQKIIPPSGNVALEFMKRLFFQTEQRLIAEITRKRNQGFVDYSEKASLRRVQKIIAEMVDESEQYVPQMLTYPFLTGKGPFKGYTSAEEIIQRTDAETRRIIEQLTDNLLGEITEAAGTVYQSSSDLIAAQNALKAAEKGAAYIGRQSPDIFRKSVLTGITATATTGAGPLTSVEAITNYLEREGLPAFVDRAGHKWSLRDYGNMATRTTFRQAQTAAELTKDDHDLYEVLRHPAPCRVCAIYSGRVYSKSGTNPNYPSLAQAFGKVDPAGPDVLSNTYLNIHPNCLCVLTRYTEKGKTDEQIQRMRDKSSFEKNPPKGDPRTKKEIEAYRQKEKNRRILRDEIKEWEKMREALGDKVPATFATFQKHKRLNDDKYKAWRDLMNGQKPPKAPPAPKTPTPKTPKEPAIEYKRFDNGESANEYFGQRPPRSLRRENREEYDRKRSEYESSAFGTWANGLSMDEQTSISNYTGDAYSGINGLLRKQMTEKMVNSWDAGERLGVRDMINNIDSALERFELKDPIRVYRTCEKDVLEALKAQPGAVFRDNGYVSTSALSKKVASGNIVMEIDVPPGIGHGAWINPLSGAENEEYEFLLPRGSEFKVLGVSQRGGDTVIHMEFTGSQKQAIEYATREEVIDRWKRLGIYDEDNAKKI